MNRRAVSRSPSSALAEAAALHQAGRLDAAEACYRQIKRRDPDYAEAQRLRGLIAHQQGRRDAAVKLIRRAAELQPTNPVHHHSLAGLLRVTGDSDGAIVAYRRAFALQPERLQNGLDLGDALAAAGHSEAALEVFVSLAEKRPERVDLHVRIATLVFERGDPAAARARLEIAQQHAPADADSQCELAAAWAGLGEHVRAAVVCEAVLADSPEHARALAALGSACQQQGQFERAARLFEQALDRDPTLGWVYTALMNDRGYRMTDERVAAMQRCIDNPRLSPATHSQVHFALGHYHDAQRAPHTAFAHFAAGNRLHARQNPFNAKVFDERIERILACCDRDFFAQRADLGLESEKPVFVVGMPRSGTSLVEQIIASHPRAHGAGELDDIGRMVREIAALSGGRRYPDGLRLLDGQTIADLAARYLGALDARAPQADRVTDKMPFNMLWLGLIALLFPNARVVYCRRDAMDNGLSCYFQLFSKGLRFAYDLEHLGRVYRQHERLMAHWAQHLPLSMLTVDYESLVADPETETRRLIAFTGLEWDARCLDFHRHDRAVRTASVWQVRQPVYRSSVERWRAYEPWLGPLRKHLER
jgi:tetratricopeptide (TPR) repeat protein